MTTPKAPPGLGAAGRRRWRAIVAKYELSVAEQATLEAACRLEDHAAVLEARIGETGQLVPTGSGSLKANPLVGELRSIRVAAAKLLQSIAFPVAADDRPETLNQRRARLASMTRWERVRAEREAAGMPTGTDR